MFAKLRLNRPNMPESPSTFTPGPQPVTEPRRAPKACVVWLYGLSGAGKSTLAAGLQQRLGATGASVYVLDGDNVRTGLSRDLGFSDADRTENIRRVAEVAKILMQSGTIVLCALITPRRAHRDLVRQIIGATNLLMVFVDASYETCARRDPKGLYARAATGGVAMFTGRDSVFEPPGAGEISLVLPTEARSPEESVAALHAAVLPVCHA